MDQRRKKACAVCICDLGIASSLFYNGFDAYDAIESTNGYLPTTTCYYRCQHHRAIIFHL